MSHFDMDDPELPPALHVDEPPAHPLPAPSEKKMIKLPLLGNVTLLQLGLMATGLIAIVLFAALRGGPKHPATAPTFATQVATPPPAPAPVMESPPDSPDMNAPLPAPVQPVPAPPAENPDVTALSQTVDGQRGEIARNRTDIDALTRRVDALEKARPLTATTTAGHTSAGVKTTRHRTAGTHRRQTTPRARPGSSPSVTTAYRAPPATLWRQAHIESLYPDLAWVKYRDSTWALRPGDTLDNVTVLKIDTLHRTVVTTAGTLR